MITSTTAPDALVDALATRLPRMELGGLIPRNAGGSSTPFRRRDDASAWY
jgi:hypothetical protein